MSFQSTFVIALLYANLLCLYITPCERARRGEYEFRDSPLLASTFTLRFFRRAGMETELLHTRALLSYLFTTFKSRSAPSPLTRAVQSLSLRIDASELRDATAELRDASDSSEDESGSVARSVASSAASEEEK